MYRRIILHGKTIVLILIAAMGMACNNTSTCLTPKTVVLRAGFYVMQNDTLQADSMLINANVIIDGASSLFGFNLKNASSFQTTISPTADSVVVYFQSDSTSFDPETIDTIRVFYTSKLNFISTACGYEYYHTLNGAKSTHNSIDTVKISNAELDGNANTEHLAILLKK